MQKTVSIVDYGLGNILSVSRVISNIGHTARLAVTYDDIVSSDFLVLPGVGAFRRGMYELQSRGLLDPIKQHVQAGKALLGICLGMQLLFESSEENDEIQGMGIIPGKVVRIVPKVSSIKVPHIGWSCLKATDASNNSLDDQFFYFVHSYHPKLDPQYLMATTSYQGHIINAMVKKNNVIGCQFHPEKSGDNGKEILKYFLRM